VRGFEPRTDAPTVYGRIKHRANAQALTSMTSEVLINDHGACPANVDTKLARARVRIPAETNWTFISGVEPDFIPTGRR
jgi:hypothetical protein